MIVRKFRGKHLPDITREVRRALGPDAVILELRRPGRWGKWLGKGDYEVLAAVEESRLTPVSPPAAPVTRASCRPPAVSAVAGRRRMLQAVAALCGPAQPVMLQPGRATLCALVGPTGVGKTTTVAKLAARFALKAGKRVALITTDTYRVGAVEQLRMYGEIMGLPVEVVERPVSLKRAVERHAGYDLVLIDTAGRNQLRQQLDEVGTALSLVKPDYTLLLVGMNTRAPELAALLTAYRPLSYNRLVAAKVDEALDAYGLLELGAAAQAPLSYLTTGQLVPDDLEDATPEHVTAALMGRWRP